MATPWEIPTDIRLLTPARSRIMVGTRSAWLRIQTSSSGTESVKPMFSRRFGKVLFLVATAACWTNPAFAAPTPSRPTADDTAEAQRLFEEALALLDQNRAHQACPKLEQSLELDPGVGTQFQLADCYERIGKRATAYRLFGEVAQRCAALAAPEHEQLALQRKATLQSQLQYLEFRIESPIEGLELSIDQIPIPREQWSQRLPIDPGEHQFEVRAEGYQTLRGIVTVSLGDQVTPLTVGRLQTIPPDQRQVAASVTEPSGHVELSKPSAHIGTYRTIGYLGAGVGVAGLAVGGVYGLLALSKKNESDPDCLGQKCSTPTATELHNDAVRAGNLSTTFFVAGGVVTAASLALLLSLPKQNRTSLTAGIGVAPNAAFARLGGQF
jgi:hypothetical protein